MGKHWHYRVCVDGKKDHSSGGWAYGHLMEWLEKNPEGWIDDTNFPVTTSMDVEDPTRITVILIQRNNAHYKRVLRGIVHIVRDKVSQKCFACYHPLFGSYFDITNPKHKEAYDKLGEIFSPYNIAAYGLGDVDPNNVNI